MASLTLESLLAYASREANRISHCNAYDDLARALRDRGDLTQPRCTGIGTALLRVGHLVERLYSDLYDQAQAAGITPGQLGRPLGGIVALQLPAYAQALGERALMQDYFTQARVPTRTLTHR